MSLHKRKIPKATIFNFSGTNNLGDEAIMANLAIGLSKIDDKIEINLVRGKRDPISVKNLPNVRIARSNSIIVRYLIFLWKIFRSDLLIIGGGGIFQDYGLKKTFQHMIGQTIEKIKIASILNKKILVIAVGAGPLKLNKSKQMVKDYLNKADLVTTRDEESANLLINAGVEREKIIVTKDLVFSNYIPFKNVKKTNDSKLHIGLSVLPFFHSSNISDENRLESLVAQKIAFVCDQLIEKHKAHITFLPMDLGQDTHYLKKIISLMKNKHGCRIPLEINSVEKVLSIFKTLDLVIAARSHSIVFSVISRKPFVALKWHPKIQSLTNEFENIATVDLFEFEVADLLKAVDYTLKNKDKIEKEIQEKSTSLQKKSEENFNLIRKYWYNFLVK